MRLPYQMPQPVFLMPQGPTADALTQAQFNALLGAAPPYAQTPAEQSAGVVPTSYAYPPGYVLRYGTNTTPGTTDMTSAFNSALAQRVAGGDKIVFSPGLYAGNFVVTGSNVVIDTQEPYYEDTQTVGFIPKNTSNPCWQIGDGTTTTRSVMFRGGLKMHGGGTAAKGILFNGVQNCWFDSLIVRGFTTYAMDYTASTTNPTAYVWINNYRLDCPASAASAITLLVTQPANYPTSYATALYLNNGAIISNTGTLWTVQINANSIIWVSNSYWTMANGVGINFPDAGGTGQIICDNLIIDTLGTNADVLVTCADNNPLPQHLYGIYTINGKVSINGSTSAVALTGGAGYLGQRTMLQNPSIVGVLDFQDTAANKADQTATANQSQKISRSGTNFFLTNSAGAVVTQSSRLQIQNAAQNGDGVIYFSTSGVQILTGTGSPAAALADGSLYLQTNAGASSPLWVRQNGAWVNVALP